MAGATHFKPVRPEAIGFSPMANGPHVDNRLHPFGLEVVIYGAICARGQKRGRGCRRRASFTAQSRNGIFCTSSSVTKVQRPVPSALHYWSHAPAHLAPCVDTRTVQQLCKGPAVVVCKLAPKMSCSSPMQQGQP
ncbi:hypothetical protein GOP47_0030342 [Adiantum capillus-veneris]|nr:hypothetical protein GOP47_0030342 [Adiantum capillus-veneris]